MTAPKPPPQDEAVLNLKQAVTMQLGIFATGVLAQLLRAAGAASVDVAVTHALFAGDALEVIRAAGVGEVWSTDCIAHPSNAVHIAPMLAEALRAVLAD